MYSVMTKMAATCGVDRKGTRAGGEVGRGEVGGGGGGGGGKERGGERLHECKHNCVKMQ